MYSAPTDSSPTRPLPWAILGITGLGAFLVGLDLSIANITFPSIQSSFAAAATGLSWILNGYIVAYAGLLIVAGTVADRYGRRRVFVVGLAGFVGASALVGAAGSVELLIVARVIQGLFAALVTPASLGLLVAALPQERRATGIALWGAMVALAVVAGPSVGAGITEVASWRWAFLLNVPVGLVALLAATRILRESRVERGARRSDLLGGLLVAVMTGTAALGIVQGESWGWSSLGIVASFLVASLSGVLLVARIRWSDEPIVPRALFRQRAFNSANLSVFVFAVGFFGMFLAAVLFLTSVWGYSTLHAGLAITPGPFIVAIVAGPAGRLAERWGFRATVVPGMIVFTLGLVWLWQGPDASPDYLAEWLPGQMLLGLGVGFVLPILPGAAMAGAPPTAFALVTGVNQTARQLGAVIGTALVVALVDIPGSAEPLLAFDEIWIVLVAAGTLATAVSLTLPARQTLRPQVAIERNDSDGRDRDPVSLPRPQLDD